MFVDLIFLLLTCFLLNYLFQHGNLDFNEVGSYSVGICSVG